MKAMTRIAILSFVVTAAFAACQNQPDGKQRGTRVARGQNTPHGVGGNGAQIPDLNKGTPTNPGSVTPGSGTSVQHIQAMNPILGYIQPQGGQVSYSSPAANGQAAQSGTASFDANNVVRWFLATHIRPKEVGAITNNERDLIYGEICPDPNACGILFSVGRDEAGGSMSGRRPLRFANNMVLSQALRMGGYVPLVDGGNLSLAFYDSRVGSVDSASGAPYQRILVVVDVNQAAAYVYGGNQFYLAFNDNYGYISLEGRIDQDQVARGEVKFYNYNDVNNQGTQSQAKLGQFQVAACAIFRCQ